jgi:hypothetical protein
LFIVSIPFEFVPFLSGLSRVALGPSMLHLRRNRIFLPQNLVISPACHDILCHGES